MSLLETNGEVADVVMGSRIQMIMSFYQLRTFLRSAQTKRSVLFYVDLIWESVSSSVWIDTVLAEEAYVDHTDYKKYARAHTYIMNNSGCHFILTNADATFPNGGAIYPGESGLPLLLSGFQTVNSS